MKKLQFILIGLTILIAVWSMEACREPNPGKAIVSVVSEDTSGVEYKITGATVIMYSKPNGSYIDYETETLEEERTTNAAGVVEFSKEYDCILNLKVSYETPGGAKLNGKGIAVFKMGETYETTVELE